MRKILVLRGGALGDFIVTLPALALLRAQWPSSRIELIGNSTAAQLATHGPAKLLDAVHSQHEARWSALYQRTALPSVLGDWLAEFDLVINYWPDPEGELGRNFPRRQDQIFLSTTAMPTLAPAAKHYCAPLRALGLKPHECWYPFKGKRAHQDRSTRVVALHPGSGSPAKNWPLERWGRLGEWLRANHHAELLLVTGEADSLAANELNHLGRSARSLPLLDLAAQLATSRLFIGHDSGVSHLAAACGIPCVLLFGPTDPAMWAPPSPFVQVIKRGAALDSITLADVQAAVSAALSNPR